MRFCEQLNEYMDTLGCLAKEVCELTGISAATFSRYRSGERLPDKSSPAFHSLCGAIAAIAREKNLPDMEEAAVEQRFLATEDLTPCDTDGLLRNFDALLSTLDLNISRLCRSINYDTSAVFRFRNGTRRPAEPESFAAAVAGYVVRELDTAQNRTTLSRLLACTPEELEDSAVCFERLTSWLLSGGAAPASNVSGFLCKLDEFDLNEYIRAIRFDELKVPTMPFQMPTARAYFGLQEMMESELDFLKATVFSRSMQPVIMYSDMPMQEMAKDPEFPKKWMFGMAMMLKKGLHLHQIHNLDRSFEDMMLGLESWIPMYMTGQISPYYMKNTQNDVFLHLLKVSGAAALSGEAVAGHHEDGRYYLTKVKKEMGYYTRRAEEMLQNAAVLMDIYRCENQNQLTAFLTADAAKPGKRRSILSTLPLYTMEEPLLDAILRRNGLPEEEIQAVVRTAAAQRRRVESILESECVEDEVPDMDETTFAAEPPSLDLSSAFCERDVLYRYEDYCAHRDSTESFARSHPRYALKHTASHAFRNLQIRLHEGQWAMVSKGKAPAIHFVIHHPKLRDAIERFIPPVVETD